MAKILVTGGAVVGCVDPVTVEAGLAVGINIAGGSINKRDGRVRLFVKGKFPGAHKRGYALRNRVVWWLRTGEVLGTEYDIHHKNTVRTDDSFDNLEKLPHVDHSRAHNPKTISMIGRECVRCGESFTVEKWRLNDSKRGRFCSRKCVRPQKLSPEHKAQISRGLKTAYAEGWR